ncbi:MAG: hypothetical protein KDC82_08560, partial [Bacteroidetes bacterium]|nr:hypothetical protein [Bacteroidota bacterium]
DIYSLFPCWRKVFKNYETPLLAQSARKLPNNHNLLVSVCNATRAVHKSPTSDKNNNPTPETNSK